MPRTAQFTEAELRERDKERRRKQHRALVAALASPEEASRMRDEALGAARSAVSVKKLRRSHSAVVDDARECAICLEVVAASDRAVHCPRGHPYHQQCIKEWLCDSKKDACPTCGAKITRRQVRFA